MKIINLAKKYFAKYKIYTFIFLILSLIIWIISLLSPYLLGYFLDNITINSANRINNLYFIILVMLATGVAEIIFSYVLNIVKTKLRAIVSFELNFDVIEHIKELPINSFKGVEAAYLNERINSDSNVISSFIIDNIINIFINILTFIVALLVIIKISVKVFIAIVILIPIYIFFYFLFKKRLYLSHYDYREQQNKFFSKMNEQLFNIKLIKIHSWGNILGEKLKISFKNLLDSAMRYARQSYLFSSVDLSIRRVANVLIMFIAGIQLINNELTIGNFVVINNYFSIVLTALSYMLDFGKTYQNSMVSYNRIIEITDRDLESNGSIIVDFIDKIELNNITFGYSENKEILKNFNNTFTKNNIYCIVGKNGSGKSTLIDILTGVMKKNSGQVLYNSCDVKDINLYELRKKNIGVMEQEPVLFSDTFINNITYNLPDIDIEKINILCDRMEMRSFIESLPDGLNSIIEEKSSNVSGGEKQKIAFIRALLKKPDVLILDEPTSALDEKSILRLKEVLIDYKKDKIIIIITHDNEMVDISDHIIKL